MPVMVKGNESVLFIHIPKSGGSSYEAIMKNLGYRELLSIRGMPLSKLKFLKCTPQHMHAEMLSSWLNVNDLDRVVTIVRDPYKRFMSEYSWQLKQGITKLEPGDWVENTMEQYCKNKFVYDNHIRPQSDFILKGAEIFQLEDNGLVNAVSYSIGGNLPENLVIPSEKKTSKSDEILREFELRRNEIVDFYRDDYKLLSSRK
ncbi:sulfotransferase family 2 domain-containing protein [Vibrio astriarenae]